MPFDNVYSEMPEDIKLFWEIISSEKGFFSMTFVPCPAMGDGEGFFTLEECKKIDEEFSKIDNPPIQRDVSEIRAVKYLILAKALEPDRVAKYLNGY